MNTPQFILNIPLVKESTQRSTGTGADSDRPLEIAFVPLNLFPNGLLHLD